MFKLVPVCVGHNSDWVLRVSKGEDASILGCSHDYVFYVSESPAEGLAPFSVGHAGTGKEWRHCVIEVH